MNLRFLPGLALATIAFAIAPLLRAADDVRTVVIVASDQMKFNVTRIEAAPGETIRVQLRNEGAGPKNGMGHNWVLLAANTDAAAFAMAAIAARDTDYIPKAFAAQVIAKTPVLGPQEVGNVTFTCPTKPGKYVYICSCMGHSMAGMRGELIVK